jgi:hypothetical protein
VKNLLDTIEHNRSEFEAALDDKQKNSTIKGARGEVNANEFFDDFEDQVQRARDRFKSDYSASSEVLSLLQYATRVQGWTATQPAGFPGSKQWGVLSNDFRRLAAAYNTGLPKPGQQGLGTIAQARRQQPGKHARCIRRAEPELTRWDGWQLLGDSSQDTNLSKRSFQLSGMVGPKVLCKKKYDLISREPLARTSLHLSPVVIRRQRQYHPVPIGTRFHVFVAVQT